MNKFLLCVADNNDYFLKVNTYAFETYEETLDFIKDDMKDYMQEDFFEFIDSLNENKEEEFFETDGGYIDFMKNSIETTNGHFVAIYEIKNLTELMEGVA